MNGASISADIISYTSLGEYDKRNVENSIKELLSELSVKYAKDDFFGRIVRGDYIECAMKSGRHALRIALILKTFIKSIELKNSHLQRGIKYYKEYGIRLAVAIAPLTTIDPENGVIDGEAIYMSGRAIKDYSTSNKNKIIIKNTMFFYSRNQYLDEQFGAIFSLLDTLISHCTAKQCKVIYFRLLGYDENAISKKLKKSQSTINQHSTAAGWHAIEKSVQYFEKYFDYAL